MAVNFQMLKNHNINKVINENYDNKHNNMIK